MSTNILNAIHAITGQKAYTTSASNAGTVFKSGYLEVLLTSDNPSSTFIIPDHAYALLTTTNVGAKNDAVFNPFNDSNLEWNNHSVYGGLFYCDQAFLNQNFASLRY